MPQPMIGTSEVVRWLVTASLLVVALVLQVTIFPPLVPDFFAQGVVPNFCLLVVVAAALVRGPEQAAVLGFVAGLLLDLVPPADHVAGRWALALVVVGYVAGRLRPDTSPDISSVEGFRPTAVAVVATVAASSFVGTSVYAITGLVLQDPVVSVGDLLPVIVAGVFWDVLMAPFVMPVLMRVLALLEPARAQPA
jgi:rod shape-determining protein MreD